VTPPAPPRLLTRPLLSVPPAGLHSVGHALQGHPQLTRLELTLGDDDSAPGRHCLWDQPLRAIPQLRVLRVHGDVGEISPDDLLEDVAVCPRLEELHLTPSIPRQKLAVPGIDHQLSWFSAGGLQALLDGACAGTLRSLVGRCRCRCRCR
jgi:hypothetical protein